MKTDWKNFKKSELVCTCCGKFNPNPEFQELMDVVQEIRDELGFAMNVNSAYRCENHPIEAAKIAKGKPAGRHSIAAIDLGVIYGQAYQVLEKGFEKKLKGLGVNQTGDLDKRFIHLDNREIPALWSY